jgi:hypothetical protein
MQQHNYDALMYEKEHRLNMLEKEEVVPRYKLASPPYYRKGHQDEELEEKAQNFEPQIHYVVDQKVATHGVKMSKGVESILVSRQEILVLPRVEPTIVEGVHVVVKVRYSEPRFNQQSGSIVRGVLRDWSKIIHSVNKVPRPNPPHHTYWYQIGHQVNECPFIEDNVK